MKRLEKTFECKNNSSFLKKNAYVQQSIGDSECNFQQDLIDEHIGISIVPVMMSSRAHTGIQSPIYDINLQRALRSIQNIENTYLQNIKQDHYANYLYKNMKNQELKQNVPFQDQRQLKSSSSSRFQTHRFQSNIQQHQLKKEKKLKEIKQILDEKQMKQCTFTPNSHVKYKKDKTPKRNLQQFLKNQNQHVNKIQKKRQDLKRIAEQNKKLQQSFKPKINKSMNQVQRDKNKKPAYQRLYELKQNKMIKESIKDMQNQKKPIPYKLKLNHKKQTDKSRKNVSTVSLLYEDAQRRQNLARSIQKSKHQQHQISLTPKNKNNQKYVAQKFIKQFCFVLQCLKLLPNPSYSLGEVSPYQKQQIKNQNLYIRQFTNDEFNQILRQLGFLVYEQNSQVQLAYKQRNLAHQGFQILQQYGVNIRNVCVFLLSLIGIFNINPINFYDHEELMHKKVLFQLDQKQGRKIHKYFDLLYRNRLTSNNNQTKRSVSPINRNRSPQQSPPSSNYVSPRHEQHTKQLAMKYRSKMIERANQRFISNKIDIVLPANDKLAHQDLLVIDSLGRGLQIKKMRQNRASILDQQCTFHPKVNNKTPTKEIQTDRGVQKSKQLYQYAKIKHQAERHNQSAIQVRSNKKTQRGISNISEIQRVYSKNNDQNKKNTQADQKYETISNKKTKDNQQKNNKSTNKKNQEKYAGIQCVQYAKDVDKAVARMMLGRKQREQKSRLLQRGQPEYIRRRSNSKSPKRSNVKSNGNHTNSIVDMGHNISTNTFQVINTDRQVQQFQDQYEESQNQPFLVIDVNMGEETQQIQFFAGDQKKVGRIVDQFCIDHDLDDECKEQLLQMVQIQISKYLNSIGSQSTKQL